MARRGRRSDGPDAEGGGAPGGAAAAAAAAVDAPAAPALVEPELPQLTPVSSDVGSDESEEGRDEEEEEEESSSEEEVPPARNGGKASLTPRPLAMMAKQAYVPRGGGTAAAATAKAAAASAARDAAASATAAGAARARSSLEQDVNGVFDALPLGEGGMYDLQTGTHSGTLIRTHLCGAASVVAQGFAPTGAPLGTFEMSVDKLYDSMHEGVFAEGKFISAERIMLRSWLQQEFAKPPGACPLLHFCARGRQCCRATQPPGRTTMHIDLWKVGQPLEDAHRAAVRPGRGIDMCSTPAGETAKAAAAAAAAPSAAAQGRATDLVAGGMEVEGEGLQSRLSGLRDRLREDRKDPSRPPGYFGDRRGLGSQEQAAKHPQQPHVDLPPPPANFEQRRGRSPRRDEDASPSGGRAWPTIGRTVPAEVLAKRAAAYKVPGETQGKRRRRRRRSRRSSSGSSAEDFHDARESSDLSAIHAKASKTPGVLLDESIAKMEEYMAAREGRSPNDGTHLNAVVETYLTTVLLPAQGSNVGPRNERELRTLARAVDKILRGDTGGAADILIQRFKAIETAISDGHWGVARHLELLPPLAVTAVPEKERAEAARREKEAIKLRHMVHGRREE